MVVNMWQDLEKEFRVKISGEWLEVYHRKEYIEMIIKRVFTYYDRSPNRPKDRSAWERAISSFLKKNKPQQEATEASTVHSIKARSDADRIEGLRKELRAMQGRNGDCPRCLNEGTVGMRSKANNNYYVMLCDCKAAEIAKHLPENCGIYKDQKTGWTYDKTLHPYHLYLETHDLD